MSIQNSSATYPVYNGIIDLIPSVCNVITGSYDQAPSPGYDEMILASKWYMKLFVRLVWGFSRPMEYIEKLHSFLPDDFEGVLLDVPVGTGALTVAKYKRMKKATGHRATGHRATGHRATGHRATGVPENRGTGATENPASTLFKASEKHSPFIQSWNAIGFDSSMEATNQVQP